MGPAPDAARRVLAGLRGRLKSSCYSGPRRERWQHTDRVLDLLAPPPGGRAADIGAGGGYFTLPLARAVGPEGLVYAVDPDTDMTRLIARRAERAGLRNVVTVEAPPDDPALPEPVDLAVIVDALHHLPDGVAYLRRLASYIEPGGRVAIIEPRPRWFLFGHATAPERIRAMMTHAGFDLVEEHATLPKQGFLVFRRRQ